MAATPSTWTNLSWTVKLPIAIINYGIRLSCRSDGTINRRLMSFFDFKAPPSSNPVEGVKTFDIVVDQSRNLWFRVFVPATNGENEVSIPVILYFHGGGFAWISADSVGSTKLCRRLSRELNAVIISVNYRNSPEHKYPSQLDDGFDALKFIDNNREFEGFLTNANLKNCFVGGDSAGGNLAHHVALKACNSEFRNVKIVGVIAIQPFFGGEERTDSEMRLVGAPFINVNGTDRMWKAFLPEGSDRNHPAANIFGPKSVDISKLNFPATIVIVAGFDPLQDWQKRYYEGLKKSGKEAYLIEYPNVFHAFYAFEEFPESSLFIDEVRNFMQKQSSK
ncbi:Alpha/beta hydrolase-3 [Melia azedarach]|uniref:Alpha/beta hydrolase-3 n=1 Tax=Melia azedarach TaxID=155640 RepID=A0ACC1XRL7_MELAZ|nr:Alpha/beta hydrolase-3 [Melia azedarach]